MAKSLAMVFGVALIMAANAAFAACSYEGQRYPTGTVLCVGGKIYLCEANDAGRSTGRRPVPTEERNALR